MCQIHISKVALVAAALSASTPSLSQDAVAPAEQQTAMPLTAQEAAANEAAIARQQHVLDVRQRLRKDVEAAGYQLSDPRVTDRVLVRGMLLDNYASDLKPGAPFPELNVALEKPDLNDATAKAVINLTECPVRDTMKHLLRQNDSRSSLAWLACLTIGLPDENGRFTVTRVSRPFYAPSGRAFTPNTRAGDEARVLVVSVSMTVHDPLADVLTAETLVRDQATDIETTLIGGSKP